MQKRSVLFINDSLWNSSGVFRALLPVLCNLDYEKYDVTLYICAGAQVDPDVRASLPEELHLIEGKDSTHYYRNVFVLVLHLLSLFFGMVRMHRLAAYSQKQTRSLIHRRRIIRQAKTYFKNKSYGVIVANTVPVCSEIARYIDADKKYVVFHSSKPEFFPALTKQAFDLFTGVIAVSEGVKQMLEQTYPDNKEKIVTVTNYVNAREIQAKAAEFPLPDNARTRLCTCGRLEKEKGFDLALEAAKLLRDEGFDFEWYFVGDGGEKQRLTALRDEYDLDNRIIFTGFRQNPYPYIAGCDIYVQPSYEEAQPLAIMEALALSRTVVSTETVGGKTLLKNGDEGILTPISAEGLAAGIETLLRDPEKRTTLQHPYTAEDDLRAKQTFIMAWNNVLSK